jgi:hypothetical protein
LIVSFESICGDAVISLEIEVPFITFSIFSTGKSFFLESLSAPIDFSFVRTFSKD